MIPGGQSRLKPAKLRLKIAQGQVKVLRLPVPRRARQTGLRLGPDGHQVAVDGARDRVTRVDRVIREQVFDQFHHRQPIRHLHLCACAVQRQDRGFNGGRLRLAPTCDAAGDGMAAQGGGDQHALRDRAQRPAFQMQARRL